MGALRRKAEEDVAEISRRLRQSEQRREELTDLKFAHEAELRELRGRSEAGEAGREAASKDAKATREANRALEARVFEAEREAERLRMQGAALAQQVRLGIYVVCLCFGQKYCSVVRVAAEIGRLSLMLWGFGRGERSGLLRAACGYVPATDTADCLECFCAFCGNGTNSRQRGNH